MSGHPLLGSRLVIEIRSGNATVIRISDNSGSEWTELLDHPWESPDDTDPDTPKP